MRVTNNAARERQSAYRGRMQQAGLVQVSAWVHRDQAAAVVDYLRLLKDNPGLEPGPLRNPVTGKLVSAR